MLAYCETAIPLTFTTSSQLSSCAVGRAVVVDPLEALLYGYVALPVLPSKLLSLLLFAGSLTHTLFLPLHAALARTSQPARTVLRA